MERIEIARSIDFKEDYYSILGIQKSDLLDDDNDVESKRQNSLKLHEVYRRQAHRSHPDLAPDGKEQDFSERFRQIVKAYTILSDPYSRKIYDSGSFESMISNRVEIDWNMVGRFKKESIENEVGSALFLSLDENLTIPHSAMFVPYDEKYHNYIWEININGFSKNLTISLVPDSDDILRLTGGKDLKESLPFKIYIFFPMIKFSILREEPVIAYDIDGNEVIFEGRIKNLSYMDQEIFEGTNLNDAIEEIKSGELEQRILDFLASSTKSR